jgi:hypothetical protein
MQENGYFVTSRFVQNGTANGAPQYVGTFVDANNTTYHATITQNITQEQFVATVANVAHGYKGAYINPTVWVGTRNTTRHKVASARVQMVNAGSVLTVY